MGIFKAPIFSNFTWEAFSNLFYHRGYSNFYFSAKLIVNPVRVLPISNISVSADTEGKNTILNAERNVTYRKLF